MGPRFIDWGKDAEAFLVKKVREYPALWDIGNGKYKNKTKESLGYNAVCQAMRAEFSHLHMLTPDIVKQKFEDMRFPFVHNLNTQIKRPQQSLSSQEIGEFFHHLERFEEEKFTPFTPKELIHEPETENFKPQIHEPVSLQSETHLIKPQIHKPETEVFEPQEDIHEEVDIKIEKEDPDTALSNEDECSMSLSKNPLEVDSIGSVANIIPQALDCDASSFMPEGKRTKRDVNPEMDLGKEASERSERISQSKRTARIVEGLLASFPPSIQLKMTVDLIQFLASRLPLYQNM